MLAAIVSILICDGAIPIISEARQLNGTLAFCGDALKFCGAVGGPIVIEVVMTALSETGPGPT